MIRKLIVGLGNPGRKYTHNRHNIGFICLNHFARRHNLRFDKRQCQARIALGEVAGNRMIMAKPQTYMNLSGEAVSRLMKKFEIELDNLIVVHDDLDLPLGKIRLRPKSGTAGHKGIKSIVAEVGSQEFIRIRVGIGRSPVVGGYPSASETDIIKYVLGDFTQEEKQTINRVIPRISEVIYCLLTEDLVTTMNLYN